MVRSPRRARAAAVAAALTLHLVTACYREVPVAWPEAPERVDVEVTLAEAEAAGLAATLGPRARSVAGRVLGRSDSTLTVDVTSVTRTSGTEESWPGGGVVLPARAVERVTVRRLARWRTAAIFAAVAAGGLLVGGLAGDAFLGGGGRGGSSPGRQ
jgi:hypothetical protein